MRLEDLRELWGKPVTVKGTVYFKPSGKVQLLEADTIRPVEPGDEIFDEMPIADSTPEMFDTTQLKRGYVSPFKELRGSWPGDESIEQILEALRGVREHSWGDSSSIPASLSAMSGCVLASNFERVAA